VQVREGEAPFRDWRTWYRVTGDLDARKLPVVILHGGPGCTHDYVDSFKHLAAGGRAVVHYDQLGNGRSTHLPDKGADFWTPRLFLDELENLLTHLGIAQGYQVIGQSWGGMLAAEHAVTQPKGLRALVIADSPASMKTWVEEANRLRQELPPDVQATLLMHEKTGTTHSPAYAEAVQVFNEKHVCRKLPWPDEVKRTFAAIAADPTVYYLMNGPSEFHVIGTLKSWTIENRLGRVQAPTLVISGAYDEATPKVVEPYLKGIKDVRWHLFEHSSHMPHVEEEELCLKVVGDFLDRHDRS
jgi:L-proline amide hydrolase